MPKQKTHKGTKKRFRLTATGKVKHRRAGTSHLQVRLSSKRKRNLRGTGVLAKADTQRIAAALGKKIVSVWGCTDPLLGMSPYRADAQSVIITPEGRGKRPCSKLGDRCKYGDDHRCIDAIDPEAVLAALKQA
jgi:large subunit ribosomal protein L35